MRARYSFRDARSEGAPVVAIDPAVENLRVRRAYATAGFAEDQIIETREGRAVVMIFEPRTS